MRIESWFLNKNFSQNERMVIEAGEYEINKETEKAVNVTFTSDYGNITRWIPKSAISYGIEKKETTSKKIKTKLGEIKEVTWMDNLTIQTSDGKTYMKFAVEFI